MTGVWFPTGYFYHAFPSRIVREVTETAAPEDIDAEFRTISLPTDEPAVNWIRLKPLEVVNLENVQVPVPSAALSVVKALAVNKPAEAAAKALEEVMEHCANNVHVPIEAVDPAGIDVPEDE